MTATLMMVTYNRLELTKQTLNYIFENTKYPFHLVIVDNGSSDDTIEYLETELKNKANEFDNFLDYKLVKNDENRGIAIGRNQGLLASQKWNDEWLATIDNDVFVPDGWLGEAISIMKDNPQYGSIGVNMEGRQYPIVSMNGHDFQTKPRGNLGTACMVFSRKLHKMLGYFDHISYKLYAHEDADFGFRTRMAGFRLGYIKTMGRHLGEGEYDEGEYREFKNEYHALNLPKFNSNCGAYARKQKPIYIDFKDERS